MVQNIALIEATTTFRLPDLISSCPFRAIYHQNGNAIGLASDKWFEEGCPDFTDEMRRKIYNAQCGKMAGSCFPYCDDEHLRVVADCLNLLFHLDDASDEMLKHETEVLADAVMNALWHPESYRPTLRKGKKQPAPELAAAKLCRDFWIRFAQDAKPGVQARFREHLDRTFAEVVIEGRSRRDGEILDLDSYIRFRREVSACNVGFALIEYGLRIELPDYVVTNPTIEALIDGANDIISWYNDIHSYNMEQAMGHKSNLVIVLMEQHHIHIQAAMDLAGYHCVEAINTYRENKKSVPSWGAEVDQDVAEYMRGVEFFMSGILEWNFVSERYFGSESAKVKETGIVKLEALRQLRPTEKQA
ncbi:terpenoid synthase [Lyophyllum atratum]|nr:terpenoid synthase [Lyophyllum atratum]